MKVQVKDKFVETFTRHHFLQSLAAPQSEWPLLVSQADKEMQNAKSHLREAKQLSEHQKNNMLQLNSVVVQGSILYQAHVDSLKEKLHTLEELLEEVRVTQKTLSESGAGAGVVSKDMENQSAELEKLLHESRKELLRAEHHKTQLEMEAASLRATLQQLHFTLDEDEELMDATCLRRMQKVISDMEELSDVLCHAVNSNTVVVEFPPRPCLAQPSTGVNTTEANVSCHNADIGRDLILKVTMTFKEDGLGYLRLHSMESNIDSFSVDDLWKEHCENGTGSLPQLVARVKARWFSHMPLLAEINYLRCRYAIDWIQKENILRVIVGKGGGIVCTLEIPPAYPHQGQVTLSSIMGVSDTVQVDNLKPLTGLRLQDWVQYLEETFGKP
ncbi:hypothetical protein BaRGS_00028748 [Batillaria attramentaria]|uniref:Uncharacterized protein n=1 Tax=Batillaria attramentaria TaxID=370345 RepID=A0ABD0JZ70_9CAEN